MPIIVINPIPGQEEENAEFLEKKGVAIWIRKGVDAKEVLTDLFHSPEKLKEMKIQAKLLAKKNSCKDICKVLLRLVYFKRNAFFGISLFVTLLFYLHIVIYEVF